MADRQFVITHRHTGQVLPVLFMYVAMSFGGVPVVVCVCEVVWQLVSVPGGVD